MGFSSGLRRTGKLGRFQKTFSLSLKETQKKIISSPLDISMYKHRTRTATCNFEGIQSEDKINELKSAEKKEKESGSSVAFLICRLTNL